MSSTAPAPHGQGAAAPLTLRIAVWLLVAQVTVEMVLVLLGDRFPAPGRVLLALCLAIGFLFARSALRLRAGGAFGMLLVELMSGVIALEAEDWPDAAQLALGVTAVATLVLVLASLHAFPSPTIPVR